jgi:tetratricopeptide (TPR) repeat protein
MEIDMLRGFVIGVTLVAGGMTALADDVSDCNQSAERGRRISGCTNLIIQGKDSKPVLSRLHYNRGRAYSDTGEFDRAIADYSKSIELTPSGFSDLYLYRALAYFQTRAFDLAIDDFNKVIEVNPTSLAAIYNRGGAYLEKGDLDRAIVDYNKAIQIEPSYVYAYFSRASAYQRKKELDRAIADYSKVIELEPSAAIQVYAYRGVAYENKGDFDRAIADHTKWIESFPRQAKGYVVRGNAYVRKGDRDLAIADYTKALELDPPRSEAYTASYMRAMAYREKGQPDLAIVDFTKCIEMNPSDPYPFHNRGVAYERQGKVDQAIDDYRASLRLAPNFNANREALNRLGASDIARASAEPQFKPHPTERISQEQWQQYFDEVNAAAGGSRRDVLEQHLVTYSTKDNLHIAFTLPGHPAHPAWITRKIVGDTGKQSVAQIGYFAGSESAFVQLFRQYQDLTKQAFGSRETFLEPVKDEPSGLALRPPAGYSAHLVNPSTGRPSEIVATRSTEPFAKCVINFDSAATSPPQEELNAKSALQRDDDRAEIGRYYDLQESAEFIHDGVHGTVLSGVSKTRTDVANWRAGVPTLIFIFYTPKGATKVRCEATTAAFQAQRPEFEAVARSVILPR